MSTEKHYAINAGSKFKYIAIIKTLTLKNGKPYAASLDLGGIKRGCISISVKVPDPTNEDERYRIINGCEVAYVNWIGYAEECSTTSDMPSGEGTRHMIRTAMSIIKQVFHWIKRFRLSDASRVYCNEKHNAVSLADVQLSLHGQTYYERYFHAYLEFEPVWADYIDRVKALMTCPMDPFELFCRVCCVPMGEIEAYIEGPYRSSTTYPEFFKNLHAKCAIDHIIDPNKKYCFVTLEWLGPFLTSKLTNRYASMEWLIEFDKIRKVEYESRKMSVMEVVALGERGEIQHGGGERRRMRMPKGMLLGPLDMF